MEFEFITKNPDPKQRVLNSGIYTVVFKEFRGAKTKKFGLAGGVKPRITFVFTLQEDPTVEIYKTVNALLTPTSDLIKLAKILGGVNLPIERELLDKKKLLTFLEAQKGNLYRARISPNKANTYSNIEGLFFLKRGGC